jgi:murein DD-endopeptidase MepM/ murein hydrolase activator NlpD
MRYLKLLPAMLLAAGLFLLLSRRDDRPSQPSPAQTTLAPERSSRAIVESAHDAQSAAPEPAKIFDIKVARVGKNKTIASTLAEMGLGGDEVTEVIGALRGIFDFRKSRVGDQVRLTRTSEGRLESMEYRASPIDEWLVQRQSDALVAEKRAVEIDEQLATVDIAVSSSLYEAMLGLGEDPSLAVAIADVFAWDVDFYRDVRKGDRVRVIVEKSFARGRLLRYGEILGVRYEGSAVGNRRLLRYTPLASTPSYFDEKGNSAKKTFLKSPLKYVHITSRFGGRRHPLMDYYQNHLGVDYGAQVGTPVWSVADGTITRVVRGDPGGGNFLFVRHANGFETGYLHLSRFAEGIHVGSRVRQKQVVAFTGNTGLSTGPHLHYAMKRGGVYINPITQRFPRPEPLPKAEIPRFLEETAHVAALLDAELIAAW